MLTTEKWGAPPVSHSTCSPASGSTPRRALGLGNRLAAACWVVLAALLFSGCEPAGPAALRKGHRLLQAGRPADAAEPLRRAIRLLGTNDLAVAAAWNCLGLAYQSTGQYPDALAAYQAALNKDFNLVAARYNRGVLFLQLNNLPAAINELTTFTTHQPGHADGWLRLGIAQLRARQYDAADRSLQQVLDLPAPPSTHAEALNNLGVSNAQRRRTREAFQFFNAALKAQPNYPPAILNQAIVAQQQLGDRRLALGRYRMYLEVAPPSADRAEVEALADRLELALNPVRPPVVAAVPTPPAKPPPAAIALSNLTEILTRTSAVVQVPTPAPAVPAVAATSAPTATSAPPLIAENPPQPAPRTAAPEPAPITPAPASPTETVGSSLPARTNLPAAVPEPIPLPAEPPPVVTQSPPAPPPAGAEAVLPPASRAVFEPEPEVVRLDTEIQVLPARDVAVRPPDSAATPAPTNSTDSVRPLGIRPIGSDRATDEKEKRSLVSRLNPLTWFGGSDQDDAQKAKEKADKEAAKAARKREKELERERGGTTPLPPPSGEPKTYASAATPSTPTETRPPKEFPRYRFSNPAAPQGGDLAAARAPFQEAVRAHQANRFTEAITAYQKAVAIAPGFFDAWFGLGVAAALSGDNPTALGAYERALALKPADTNTRFNLALALNASGYPLDAVEQLENVVAAKPDYVDAHLALGGIYADQLGDYARARTRYQRVLELAPRHPKAPEIRRWLADHR